jgi:hypothetical protein
LAGESAADDIDAPLALRRERPHVVVLWHFGPVLVEDCSCIRVNLHLPFANHAGPLKSKVEAADTGEE